MARRASERTEHGRRLKNRTATHQHIENGIMRTVGSKKARRWGERIKKKSWGKTKPRKWASEEKRVNATGNPVPSYGI